MFAQNLERLQRKAARVVELEREVAVMDAVLSELLDHVNRIARLQGRRAIVRFDAERLSKLADESQTEGAHVVLYDCGDGFVQISHTDKNRHE